MENQRQKWVNLVFTTTAILVAWVASIALTKVSAVYSLESSIKQIDLVILFSSMGLGLITGLTLYFNDRSNVFMNEVVLEMFRVTWPTSKETTNATIWVLVFVLIAGGILGAFDALWSWIIRMIL